MKRKRRRKRIWLILAVCVLFCGACAFVLAGFSEGGFIGRTNEGGASLNPAAEAAGCLVYMGNYVCFDIEGNVVNIKSDEPESLPVVKGLSVNSIVAGKSIKCNDEADLSYVLGIIRSLRQNSIHVDEIYISSDSEATVYVNDLKILLGEDDNTANKLNDLRLFYESVEGLAGTLYMQEYSKDNIGYSFRYT